MTLNIIHDKLRIDRFELMMKEISEHKLEYRIWDAVKEFPKPKQNISEAHKRVVRWAKDNNEKEVLIAEDDFHLTAHDAFQYFLNKKPKEFDLYLAGIIWGRIQPNNTTSDYAGNQFYIIHERYYNIFLESDPNKDIDREQRRKGIFYVCNPLAVIQHETFSDNMKKIHSNKKLYRDKIIYDGTNG